MPRFYSSFGRRFSNFPSVINNSLTWLPTEYLLLEGTCSFLPLDSNVTSTFHGTWNGNEMDLWSCLFGIDRGCFILFCRKSRILSFPFRDREKYVEIVDAVVRL